MAVWIGVALAVLVASALAHKWHLGLRRAVVTVGGLGTLTALLVGQLLHGLAAAAVAFLLTLCVTAAVLAQRFYRDPERVPPPGDGLVVSPADGEVVYVRHSVAGRLPVSTKKGSSYTLRELVGTDLDCTDAVVVGIAMNFLDVHVNRAPITGRVTAHHHHKGQFRSLRDPESIFENERATTIIENDTLQVAVVQIASRLVRQIVARVRTHDQVLVGDRIGVIRFGSQVDLVLPAHAVLQIRVSEGDRVRAGESVLAAVGPEAEDHGQDVPTATPADVPLV